MKLFWYLSILAVAALVLSCTGQKPAPLKNSTTPRNFVKESCSEMVFEGQVLSKKNILNIFECSGWAKQYPDLSSAIRNADEEALNKTFEVYNNHLFKTADQRKTIFEIVATAESKGELESLSKILEKGLSQHRALNQVSKALNHDKLSLVQKNDFLKILSDKNQSNLEALRAVKNIAKSYENYRPVIHSLLTEEDKEKLIPKIVSVLDDLAQNMDAKDWDYLSKLIFEKDSALKNWSQEGIQGDLRVLLDVIEDPAFFKDVIFLRDTLVSGVSCGNRASSREFQISIKQELKHKIEGLKVLEKEPFEKMLLHGLTKYSAFQEFCEEKTKLQGVKSYFNILNHAFRVLPSAHDFKFLKRIHQVFAEDRFLFVSFLSSESFASLRNLFLELNANGRDTDLVKNLYEVMAQISDKDLKVMAELVNGASVKSSQTQKWKDSWSTLWTGLSMEEKEDFVRLLSTVLNDDLKASDALNPLEEVLTHFPDFSVDLAQNFSDAQYQNAFRQTVNTFSSSMVEKDLGHFLSEKGFFEFISILTQEYKPIIKSTVAASVSQSPLTYVTTVQSQSSVQTRSCFNELSAKYKNDSSYYNLVNTLPDSCLSVLGDVGFVGRIFLWMNSSEAYFKDHYKVDDFHSATGVWAPGMLQFIFSAAVKADMELKSSIGKDGILKNLDEIHRTVTDPRLLATFHQFSNFYLTMDEKLKLDSRLLKFLNEKNDKELNRVTDDFFEILKTQPPTFQYVVRPSSCKDLSDQLGASPCLERDELVASFTTILRTLQRKNEEGTSLASELVSWIHPNAGVSIPFNRNKQEKYHTSFDEIIRFFFDLSNEKTIKGFKYRNGHSLLEVSGTVLDRLEVVIRDIGFLNNFYGAYFKNEISGAEDYRVKVQSSEKLLVLLDSSSGVFRTFGGLPRESRFKLKNIRQTYSSLVEVSDDYKQEDGTVRTYGPFIQSLLTTIAASSKKSTQDFNAYRVPNERVVSGHNGVFLTEVVKMSGLRHMSQFFKNRMSENLSELNSKEFKKINSQLVARHDVEKIQLGLASILDRYLDQDRNQLNLLITDGVDFFSVLDSDEQKSLEQILVKTMMILSEEKVSTEKIQKLASSLEVFIEMWPEVREVLVGVKDKKYLLQFINELLDGVVHNPENVDRLLDVILSSDLFSKDDFKTLIKDPKFRLDSLNLINEVTMLREIQSNLNWASTIHAIFSSDMKWEALKTWFAVSLGNDPEKLTLSLLIEFLGEKKGEEYRLKSIMDELFLNHRPELQQFLQETFKSLELKPD